ncbi:hypothetical protein [Rhodoferax sp.]|uniref:hypothetical protein n=1 Tax=Rhodoferax sp. TaxID=50421 RepID=UPI002605D903|nr:hypothetical protein [Rhodoferax sp.]MDD2925846.1 hypothetical protein [Rhodoferax sp.]
MRTAIKILSGLLLFLSACSSGRYYKPAQQNSLSYSHTSQEAQAFSVKLNTSCNFAKHPHPPDQRNTVFVHPGLLLLNFDWDQSLAIDSAKLLVREGFARDFLELRDRKVTKVGPILLKDPGTRFMGLHYSMGGHPQLIAQTLQQFPQAREASGKNLVYYPVLIDPFDIGQISKFIDLNAEYLGQIFIVLSEEKAFFRPSIDDMSEDTSNHPKVHFIYAEDIGAKWGHFDALKSIKTDTVPSRFRDIFFLIANTIVEGATPAEFEARFAVLKAKYAIEDARNINAAWLQLASRSECNQPAQHQNP